MIWTAFIILLSLAGSAFGGSNEIDLSEYKVFLKNGVSPGTSPQETSDLEAKVIDVYERNRCRNIKEVATFDIYNRLTPLALAVVAYCDPDDEIAEALFKRAEQMDRSRDTIFLLHAQRVWRRDRALADPIFRQAMLLARNQSTRTFIRQYLNDNATGDELIAVSRFYNSFAIVQVAGGYESNPALLNVNSSQIPPSLVANVQANLGVQRRYTDGFIGGNYSLGASYYPEDSSADFFEHRMEFPLSLRAGPREDIRLRPFGSYIFRGATSYYLSGGLGALGVAYRGSYRQILQGSVYQDKFFVRKLVAQAGTHFRFEYVWDYYPKPWFIRGAVAVEHVQAGRETTFFPGAAIPYSHNDVTAQGFLEYQFEGLILGISGRMVLREDDNASTYPRPGQTAPVMSKRRQDLQVTLQPTIAFPVRQGVDLIALYRWSHIFSNMGSGDYEDKNFQSHLVLGAVRVSWSEL